MIETKSERHSNASAAAPYYGGFKHVDKKGPGFCKSANVDASKRGYGFERFSIFLFLVKTLIFVSFVMLLQLSLPGVSVHEGGVRTHYATGNTAKGNYYTPKARGNRILAESLKSSNTTFEKLEQNTVDKIENIYEQLTRSIASKIMAFIKKIDLTLEKEIAKTLKYIDTEKDEPVKYGLTFYEKLKKFFSAFKVFSTPVLGAFAAMSAYYFKAQAFTALVSLSIALLPFLSTFYLMYKVIKVRGDMAE
ncbi:Plasmodium exported protein, unknown function [Plasmodium knowlesi strain H]|uniref:Uncharacterized protein n=3 Tax=Plasmodium knowlesi TaxID=5850 RepID=A0A5K1U7I0_PLAKH|nr:Plasmodium exported protein, unknown function [Plasmodium knowlesi strain H]OTN66794.1 Uncharacterized protein PKNOH_S08507800 [Plasmodium knowlesi]CAA9986653.1 Plasmodium exported protein, unknown function [Plasmodium knowlesi strain H]SBO23457.1 Plasmodium exported protein, unknown function [Plasmodium knowlesi strain H]SBO24887.1 Plasmodium exported protein, unknown function [Plasmodium knowlesi strain H]VVS76127.1 Plasmodium exported protein, unknown function [Plasmodium knowlesi strain|eukprot:XP_002257839.1 hypothetical protein, conserved in Plasmodium species [Plasmodium knowlesi strain H]